MTLPGEFNQAIVAYTTDSGEVITISQKRSLALILGNPIVQTRTRQGIAERWALRFIYIATVFGGTLYRRKIVIASATNPAFVGLVKTISIDGVIWQIIERRGEYRRGPYAT